MSAIIYRSAIQVPTLIVGKESESKAKISGASQQGKDGVAVVVDEKTNNVFNKDYYNGGVLTSKSLVGMEIRFKDNTSKSTLVPREEDREIISKDYEELFFNHSIDKQEQKYSYNNQKSVTTVDTTDDQTIEEDDAFKKAYTITFPLSNNEKISYDVDVPIPYTIVTSVNGRKTPTGIYAPTEAPGGENLIISTKKENTNIVQKWIKNEAKNVLYKIKKIIKESGIYTEKNNYVSSLQWSVLDESAGTYISNIVEVSLPSSNYIEIDKTQKPTIIITSFEYGNSLVVRNVKFKTGSEKLEITFSAIPDTHGEFPTNIRFNIEYQGTIWNEVEEEVSVDEALNNVIPKEKRIAYFTITTSYNTKKYSWEFMGTINCISSTPQYLSLDKEGLSIKKLIKSIQGNGFVGLKTDNDTDVGGGSCFFCFGPKIRLKCWGVPYGTEIDLNDLPNDFNIEIWSEPY